MKSNLELSQGITKSIPVVARNDSGARLDLTGLTGSAITWKLARSADCIPVISYTIGNGITVTSATLGEFTIIVTPASLDEEVFNAYVHECKVTISGVVYRPLWGNAFVTKDIEQ